MLGLWKDALGQIAKDLVWDVLLARRNLMPVLWSLHLLAYCRIKAIIEAAHKMDEAGAPGRSMEKYWVQRLERAMR